jgi:tetratricopeptide (TPR) repeat protein
MRKPWRNLSKSLLNVSLTLLLTACGAQRAESNQLVGQATARVSEGDVSRGMELLRQALDKDSTNALAHYYLGFVELQNNNNTGRALEAFDAAVTNGADSAELHYQRGLALLRLERPSDAQSAFELATSRDPSHARAWFRLGELAEGQGEIRLAVDLYTRSIYNEPRLPMGYSRLAGIYSRFGRPSEAIAVLGNAISNENPLDAEMLGFRAQNRADLGHVYLELGEHDRAIDYLRQSLALRPNAEAVSFNLGLALRARYLNTAQESDRQEAVGHLQRASELCNPAAELARCEALDATLRSLRQSAAPR